MIGPPEGNKKPPVIVPAGRSLWDDYDAVLVDLEKLVKAADEVPGCHDIFAKHFPGSCADCELTKLVGEINNRHQHRWTRNTDPEGAPPVGTKRP